MQPFTSGLTTGTGGDGIGYPVDLMTIGRERRERETDAGFAVNATDLTGKFDTGIINHTLTAGVELSRETRNQTRTDLCVPTGPTANLACYTSLVNPRSGGVPATGFTVVPGNNTLSTDYAAYVIDQMKITQYFELMGSFRFDRFYTHYVDASAVAGQQDLRRTDNLPELSVWRRLSSDAELESLFRVWQLLQSLRPNSEHCPAAPPTRRMSRSLRKKTFPTKPASKLTC